MPALGTTTVSVLPEDLEATEEVQDNHHMEESQKNLTKSNYQPTEENQERHMPPEKQVPPPLTVALVDHRSALPKKSLPTVVLLLPVVPNVLHMAHSLDSINAAHHKEDRPSRISTEVTWPPSILLLPATMLQANAQARDALIIILDTEDHKLKTNCSNLNNGT